MAQSILHAAKLSKKPLTSSGWTKRPGQFPNTGAAKIRGASGLATWKADFQSVWTRQRPGQKVPMAELSLKLPRKVVHLQNVSGLFFLSPNSKRSATIQPARRAG